MNRTRFESELHDLGLYSFGDSREYEKLQPDTRKRAKDSFAIPFRFICHLKIFYKDSAEKNAGTGVLISPRHVLTAAHNLYTETKLRARRVIVSPARNGDPNSIGELSTYTWQIHKFWEQQQNGLFDYALITLKDEIGRENYSETDFKPLGFWGDSKNGGGTRLMVLDGWQVDGKDAYVAGYPSLNERNNYSLFLGAGKVFGHIPNQPMKAADLIMQHTVSTSVGQSGAPVWIKDRVDLLCLVGLHLRGGRKANGKFISNFALRFNQEVKAQVETWMKT